jgi:hypothetical protein
MNHHRTIRLFLLACAAVVAASPVTVSSSGRIEEAKACADGTCCSEPGSLCFINGIRTEDAYYKGTGSCSKAT